MTGYNQTLPQSRTSGAQPFFSIMSDFEPCPNPAGSRIETLHVGLNTCMLPGMNSCGSTSTSGNTEKSTSSPNPLERNPDEGWISHSGASRDINDDFHYGLVRIRKTVNDLARFANIDYADELVEHLEGVVALIFTVQGCTDYMSMSTAVFLYVRKFLDKSASSHIMDYMSDLFLEPQAGSEDDEDIVTSKGWVDMMINLRDNWSIVKDNRLFSHFSKLLGLIVTLELCKVSDLTFTVKDYKIWEPDMKVVHGSAMDVFDAALSTVTFFVENISLCWGSRSLRPLLMNDRAAVELDEEYATLIMWWGLVQNGNLKRVANISEKEFDRRLENLTTKLKNLMGALKSFDKKMVQDKFIKLLKIKNDYITMKISCGVRKSPFCLELFGASSQGKTTCSEQIIQALLVSADLPTGKEFQASYNPSDKYMSNWSTDKVVMIVDDMANDKSNFVEKPPTRAIIEFANNTPQYANMAEIDKKGKVFVEPELCVVTTNVKDLDARVYSNCPYSIQRRMHVVITVEAKHEFQFMMNGKPQGIDPSKVAAFNAQHPDAPFDDIWNLTLEQAVAPEKLTTSAGYAPIVHNGKSLVDISMCEAVNFLIERFAAHSKHQDNIVSRMKKRQNISKCGIDGCKQIKGYCSAHEFHCKEAHFGEEIVSSVEKASSIIMNRIRSDIFGIDRAIEGATTLVLMSAARKFSRHWDWLSCIPTPWLKNHKVSQLMMAFNRDKLRSNYIRKTCLLWSGIGFTLFCTRKLPTRERFGMGIGMSAMGLTIQKDMVRIVKQDFSKQCLDRNTISPALAAYRDRHVGKICAACGIVGALYGISRVYKAWRAIHPQGSLEPKTLEDVKQRDAETNVWTGVSLRDLPVSEDAANTTSEQLIGLVEKNIVYGSVVVGSRTLRVNGLFITSNVVVMPDHYFEEPEVDVTFRKKNPETSGGKFATKLSILQSEKLPNSDLRICYSSTGGSFKDIRKYLCLEDIDVVEFALRWRDRDGGLLKADGLAATKPTSNGVANFVGLYYNSLTIDTFPGMCGAVLVSKRKPIILGVHLGGKSGTPRGCAGYLRRHEVDAAISRLRKKEAVIVSGSAEQFEAQVMGKKIVTHQKLHPKSPLNYMPEDSQIAYFGGCGGMNTFKSDVKVTPISEHVMDVTGNANIYSGPVESPQWFGWQKCLSNMAVPALPYSPKLLTLAVVDYKAEMLPIFESHLWNNCKPLTFQENMNGIDGCKFIDAMKLSTSPGHPLSGSKLDYIEIEIDPNGHEIKTFVPALALEQERCEGCWKRGERAYIVAKACKKDEILAMLKALKCRIFFSNGILLTFAVRKYFLPIVRVLQMNPKISECAVGVNSHGPEWQELHEHIMTFGDDRLIGGDYGKYDQKLPAQLLFAALRILIDFARVCNYSEEDLAVMEAMTGDIVYSVIAFNGDLIGLTEGTHISGNSLTVILNGICGSLNLRCFFYDQYPCPTIDERLRFREHVKLMTYGDDNIGSASLKVPKFTIKGASEFLAEYGQTYTMPDKESDLLPYLPPEEFEFLKRKSVYHPDLGVHVGALIDKSCFKMLHCFLRGKNPALTEEHACAQNIDTALREWFNHGREHYELRREQMIEVARRAEITHLCTQLDVSYEDAVLRWKEKYLGLSNVANVQQESFTVDQP